SFSEGGKAHFLERSSDRKDWKAQMDNFFPSLPSSSNTPEITDAKMNQQDEIAYEGLGSHQQPILQWREYIIRTMKSGLLLMHQKRALERIQYERLQERINQEHLVSQTLLFPTTLNTTPADSALLEEILPFLKKLGYDISPFGH